MQGWWVKYAEKSKLERKNREGLSLSLSSRSSLGESSLHPASASQTRGSDYDHSLILENSTPRRPIEPEVIKEPGLERF